MKTALTSLIFFICGITMIINAQIPNPSFENWTGGDPDGWATSNIFPAGIVNITQTTDRHSGTYAVLGEVVDIVGTPMAPFIQSGPGGIGFPISEKYNLMELYYKFTSAEGDKFSVNVALTKNGNTIAQGAVALPADIEVYTLLGIQLDYNINVVPDSAIIQIAITGPVIGSDTHLGSVMFVDDVSFSFSAGIEHPSISDLMVQCYPNPSSDLINILLKGNVSGEVILNVFDVYGKEIKEMAGKTDQNGKNLFQLSVEDLSPGLYFYSINGQNSHYQGKFTVSR
jgi:hypothetical protein